jgi:hypothetical protein
MRARALTPERFFTRFWSMVAIGDGCWEWQHNRSKKGYGVITHQRRQQRASRLVWEFCFGSAPGKMQVLHRCDNPPCVRPDHLFLGTIADNMRDKRAKGRQARGERNGGGGKLSAADIPVIRERIQLGETFTSIGRDFGVSRVEIAHIAKGRHWSHV